MNGYCKQTRRRKVIQPKRFICFKELPDCTDEEEEEKYHWDKKRKSKLNKKREVNQTQKKFISSKSSDDVEGISTKDVLNEDERQKYGSEAYACPDCTRVFRSSATLVRHQRSHSGCKPFICDTCKQGFSSAVSLKEHVAKHEDKKLYECNICSKKFRQNSSFHRHMAIHSNKLSFACTVCNRHFALKEYLRSHMTIHTGIKKHACDECKKCFAHSSDLKRHKTIHSGLRPYKCDVCDMRFSDQSSRRRHVREHDKVKPQKHNCHHCTSSFSKPHLLKQHVAKSHSCVTSDSGQILPPEKSLDNVYSIDVDLVSTHDTSSVETRSAVEEKSYLPCLDVDSDFQSITVTDETKLPTQIQQVDYDYLEAPNFSSNFVITNQTLPFRESIPVQSELLPTNMQERYYTTMEPLQKSQNFDPGPHNVHSNSMPIDYVSFPDFNSQAYYSWLSDFTSLCKLLTFPIELELFSKISQVYKSIVDALSEPSGILSNRNNFRVLRSISQDLFHITNDHLNFTYDHLPK